MLRCRQLHRAPSTVTYEAHHAEARDSPRGRCGDKHIAACLQNACTPHSAVPPQRELSHAPSGYRSSTLVAPLSFASALVGRQTQRARRSPYRLPPLSVLTACRNCCSALCAASGSSQTVLAESTAEHIQQHRFRHERPPPRTPAAGAMTSRPQHGAGGRSGWRDVRRPLAGRSCGVCAPHRARVLWRAACGALVCCQACALG